MSASCEVSFGPPRTSRRVRRTVVGWPDLTRMTSRSSRPRSSGRWIRGREGPQRLSSSWWGRSRRRWTGRSKPSRGIPAQSATLGTAVPRCSRSSRRPRPRKEARDLRSSYPARYPNVTVMSQRAVPGRGQGLSRSSSAQGRRSDSANYSARSGRALRPWRPPSNSIAASALRLPGPGWGTGRPTPGPVESSISTDGAVLSVSLPPQFPKARTFRGPGTGKAYRAAGASSPYAARVARRSPFPPVAPVEAAG